MPYIGRASQNCLKFQGLACVKVSFSFHLIITVFFNLDRSRTTSQAAAENPAPSLRIDF